MRGSVPGGRVGIWVALATSLLAATLFVALKVTAPSDGGRVAFYDHAWTAAGVQIDPIDAPQPDLRGGDQVRAIDGRSMEGWADAVLDPTATRPAGHGPHSYEVERSGHVMPIGVTWSPPGVGAAIAEGWGVVVLSIGLAAIAGFVLARRPAEPAAAALVLVACGVAGSSVPWFIGTTTSDVALGGPFLFHALLTAVLYMVTWPAAVHLAMVFPSRPVAVARRPWVAWLPYPIAFGAYVLALAAARLATPSTLEWIGTWPRIQLAVVVPCLAVWLALAAYSVVRPADERARRRSRWALFGATTSAVLGLALFQIPELVLGQSLVPASWIGLIALPLPLGLAVGILRDRLFDIDAALNRTMVYGGLTLAVLAAYFAAVYALTAMAGHDPGFAGTLLATGLVALLVLPVRDVLQRGVNRLMYGERNEPWRAMRRLGQRLEFAAEPDRAFPAIVETVADALRLPYVSLEVHDEDGSLVEVAARGERPAEVVTVPITHGAEPVGRLVLGVRSGERGFRKDELGLVEDLGRQAGTAVRAMRLRDDLVRSRERLVLAREEERRRLRRDLHDGLGPTLAAIGMRAEASSAVLASDPAAARRQLEALGAEVREALADVRRLVDGLRPPALDELGLAGAIGQQAARLDRGDDDGTRSSSTRVVVEPADLPELPAAVEVAAYRIAVEAMTNAVRHAGASACRIALRADSQLTIEVTDDGRGLPEVPRRGTGLESMQERAAEVGGEVAVERRPEGGTRVLATLPLGRAASP
jgi:signal transduction histidine kinase